MRQWAQTCVGVAVVVVTVGLAAILLLVNTGCNGELGNVSDGNIDPVGDAGPNKAACGDCASSGKICSAAGQCIAAGTCLLDGDCKAPTVCDPTRKVCVSAQACGAESLALDVVAPTMLIVLDRSCSMKTKVGTRSKWEHSVSAIDKVLTRYSGMGRFGLILFPDTTGQSCMQDGPVAVAVGSGKESQIQSLLKKGLAPTDPFFPDGPCVTNIDTAMQQAAAQPALAETTRSRFVLLISDGAQAGCSAAGGDTGTTGIIASLKQKNVSTFVVGFGSAVDASQLNVFADAGGKPVAGTTRYYRAEDETTLEKALGVIAGQTLGCVVRLQKVPPSVDKVSVYLDQKEVPQAGAWNYDTKTNQITFTGATCTKIEGGQVKSIDVRYGCKSAVPPPASCPTGVTACKAVGVDGQSCPAKHTCMAGCCTRVID